MTQRLKVLIWALLFSFPFVAFGQMAREYEEEEIKVINQFFYKFIESDSLIASSNLDKVQIVYFNTKLDCNLGNPIFKGNYKPNRLLKKLENNLLGIREIDSTKINRFNNVKIFFEDNRDYSIVNYIPDNVIGTLSISRISFNKSLTVGYFYVSVYCGGECGWGNLIKIKKKNGNWIIVDYLSSYIS